jgi:HK97 family phage prohead protease
MPDLNSKRKILWAPFVKIGTDDEQMCYGYASTEAVDSEGEIITKGALEGALPAYMEWANLREMHNLSAVGTTNEANMDEKGLYIGAKVVDPLAWTKVREGVYKGFSIGGRATKRDPHDRKKITGLELIEISLVDRPANPEARIEVWKAEAALMPDPKTHKPVQTWNCGLPGHLHKTSHDAVRCMKAQEDRFGAALEPARNLAFTLANGISDLDTERLAKASEVFESWERAELQEAAEDKEAADQGSIEVLAERLKIAPPPKEASVADVAKILGCSPERAQEAINLNIIRDNPTMAKMMGLIKVDEEGKTTPVVLPELAGGSTGDPKLDQGLREAAALIARAEQIDPAEKKKKPEPDKEPDADDDDKAASDDGDGDKPYGNVKYADPGYQADGKKRYPIDTEDHIRAAWSYINKEKNCGKYSASQCSSIKRRIVSAWKSTIDPKGPPSAEGKGKSKEKSMPSPALAKLGKPDASLGTKKGIETVISALALLKQIKRIKDCLVLEKDKEGDESDQSTRWAAVLESIGSLVQDLAKEEIGEMMEGPDIDCMWDSGPYGMLWAAKALKPAMFAMSKSDFVDTFDDLLGDDTAAKNYLKLAEFAEAVKAGGRLSIEEWSNPGEGTEYGAHSSEGNDTWGSHGDTAQKVHDAMVALGAKCKAAETGDTEKEHSDIPGATGPGDPKDPPKDIRDGTGGHSDIPGAVGPGRPKEPPKELADRKKPKPGSGMRGDDEDKDPDAPGEGKKAAAISGDKLATVLVERLLEQNDRMMDIIERTALNGAAADRDAQRNPPPPRKGTLFSVEKGDDYQPAPGSDGKGRTTGDTTEADPMDTLKAIHNTPRFLSR